jgi:Tfp pilus assembly protein PilO
MQSKYSRYYTYVKPIARNKFVRSYATTIFNLIAISIFALYAIRPTVITILALQKSVDEQKNILTSVVEKRESLAKGRANYESLDPSVKTKLTNLIPNQPDLPVISAVLGSLITRYEATVAGIQFQPVTLEPLNTNPNKTAAIQEAELSFSIQGTYNQLGGILESLKKIERLISIKSISMNRLDGGMILMVVNAKAYYLKN